MANANNEATMANSEAEIATNEATTADNGEGTANNEAPSKVLPDVDDKIIRQLEYYFGDLNLPKDRFLQEEIKKDDGWVPISLLTCFNRLKSLSTDVGVIAAALKKSANQIIEVSEDETKIRRSKSTPLPENRIEFWKQLKSRTIYVKGFPEDSTLDKLMEFFAQFGKIDNLVMRRTKDGNRVFKGSVFVTLQTRDLCESFIKLESVKYGDTELSKMFEYDYYAMKKEEKRSGKSKQQDEKKSVQQHQKKNVDRADNVEELKYTTGLVVHVWGLPADNKVDRDIIKAVFATHGEVDWIDFNRGDVEAWVRVKGAENSAQSVLDKIKGAREGKLLLEDSECESVVLSGEEEKNYWIKTRQSRKDFLANKGGRKKNFKQGNRKDFRRGGKRDFGRGDRRNPEKSENGSKLKEDAKKEAVKRPGDSNDCSGDGPPAAKIVKAD